MIYFFSDVHLGLGERDRDRQRERDLVRFLGAIEGDCERLFIVGDLFDYWFEYKTVIPKYHIRTIAALAHLRERDIPVEYVIGNHDFGHRNFFEQELGIPTYGEDIVRELNGRKFYIAHGDGKAHNDQGYLILRKILRNRFLLGAYEWLHPDIGVGLAAYTSRSSRAYTDQKDYGDRDGLYDFAEKKITEEGFDFVVMGHRHKPILKNFGSGVYANLGDWLHHRTYGRFDGENFFIEKIDEILGGNA